MMDTSPLELSRFDYDLPSELIAQQPPAQRGESRLLVVDREAGTFEERRFSEMPGLLAPGDRLVVNRSRVIPARLLGTVLRTGRAVEILLHEELGGRLWSALVRPSSKVRPGDEVEIEGSFALEVGESLEGGQREVRFRAGDDPVGLLERYGHVPLPPYITRADGPGDRERYQTVYAREPGSVAAPTAGLHLSRTLLGALGTRGVEILEVVLHVGLGTFQPLRHGIVAENRLHEERFTVPAETLRGLGPRGRGDRGGGVRPGRVVAVGTTTVRVLESLPAAATAGNPARDVSGRTDLFIHPPHAFGRVEALLTNFHLPRSSLLLLVCAFGGTELVLEAYRHAVDERFRFFSYGDAMFIR